MFQTKVVEKIKTLILSSIIFFSRKSCCLWDYVGKNIVERGRPQTTISNGAERCGLLAG
jgi:hypothetical protein